MEIETIKAAELKGKEGLDLIDVRTPAEYEDCHAVGARLIPLDRLNPADFQGDRGGKPLYVLCKSGGRARKACESLAAAGVTRVVLVEGGTLAWEAAGLPVDRGRAVMSLERQVRIAAGSLVAVGTALGAFVHPGFLIIPGFVGCGLTFAGITDTCGMGMLLAKMPWNQRAAACRV